jgi:hypothetical protein
MDPIEEDVSMLLACLMRERMPLALSMDSRRDATASAVRGSSVRAMHWLDLRVQASKTEGARSRASHRPERRCPKYVCDHTSYRSSVCRPPLLIKLFAPTDAIWPAARQTAAADTF